MISKTRIEERISNKRNPEIVDTIELAKEKGFLEIAKKLSGPKSNYINLNIEELNQLKDDKILIAGKVLGNGEIKGKKKVIALGFSQSAKEKLKKAGCEVKTIMQEIKDNPKLEGVKII